MIFDADQRDHMRSLAETPAEHRYWSGWCTLPDRVGCCAGSLCPVDATLADNLRTRQPCCGRPADRPDASRTSGSHYAGCTAEYRWSEIEHVDLGGEAGGA